MLYVVAQGKNWDWFTYLIADGEPFASLRQVICDVAKRTVHLLTKTLFKIAETGTALDTQYKLIVDSGTSDKWTIKKTNVHAQRALQCSPETIIQGSNGKKKILIGGVTYAWMESVQFVLR